MLLVGNIRNRRRASGWHFLTNLLSTFVVAVLNVLGWLVVAIVQGNWAWLMVGIAVVVSLLFFVAALVGLLLTHFAIFRHRAASRESVPSVPAGSGVCGRVGGCFGSGISGADAWARMTRARLFDADSSARLTRLARLRLE